ncbi:transglutaminase-like superfamily domain-containing protein [Hirsutella rhossiliensis]|uniref:Transglutaminase-like superfamily domain-containing protein n=1 Tax=Hirsutella rhossiliensis TaxID=111463 RepID=A0A9P8MN02_9HYPO|nr:transglutaminase-like superfamily domain-containing protein [Hirsutella rhossiliensis]KAH0957999.1 transglutaminase-like superfamily domain-containing protein [Hirsutella rhossiliensis]
MSLDKVPDEIIQHLLHYFHRLANEPLLWRYHCRNSFNHWHQSHEFRHKLRCKASEVDWKQLFVLRAQQNRLVADLLDGIIATQVGRLKRFESIARLGYDAKDFLLEQCRIDESAPDFLARRYYSNSLLDSIHRSTAIEEWHKLRRDRDSLDAHVAGVRLERALGAFDMFVLHDQFGDLDDVSQMLDDKAAEFRASQPNLDALTTRQKALALNRWLRSNGLTGLCNPERNYRNLRNLLIGQALRHEDHESIPLISSAIFCCLAARLGLTTQCCAFPGHVHAIVFATPGRTLDGSPVVGDGEPRERMYLDPYGLDDEVPTACLQVLLARFGWQTSTDVFFAPVPTLVNALRTARNIKATFARVLELQDDAHPELSQLLRGNSSMNMEAALYASMWAPLMLTPPNTFEWDDCLANFLRRFAGSWPEDAWLVEKYLKPLYNSFAPSRDGLARHANRGLDDPWGHLRRVREQDALVPRVFRRNVFGDESIPFKVGQVFRHRRYGWIGVITGWSDQGTRDLPVTHPRNLDEQIGQDATAQASLPLRPPNQFFFMCFPSTGSEPHKVAADSVELVHDASQVDDDMFPLAGKFFKSFDRATCTFVSNIKEQYPDD